MLLAFQACGRVPPRDIDDLCAIFEEREEWREATAAVRERWKVPEPVQLALLHQESRFRSEARPGFRRVLWIIPAGRLSSAFGYGQVKDGTWSDYLKHEGRSGARRDSFPDAVDFVGWYASVIHRATSVEPDDTFNLYLAYHEGPAGYARGSYRDKDWLVGVAHKVEARAALYAAQFATCGGPPWPPGPGSNRLSQGTETPLR